jgi:quercetin dioxygenase-like cupin family protein
MHDIEISNDISVIQDIVNKIKLLLVNANLVIPKHLPLEISHHYGLNRFHEFGTSIIEIINREYCKKYLFIFPSQLHPEHYHKVKEETFICLFGEIELIVNNNLTILKAGELRTILPGEKHSFSSKFGAIIEEVSTKHLTDDSYYSDPKIQDNAERKTKVSYW